MSNPPLSFEKRTLLLIGVATLVRIVFCSLVELNNDEVYYYTYARFLQWNYFDHPPMVGLCIRFFTAGCTLNHELFIRCTSIISSAVCTWIIFRIGKLLQDAYTGWLAACLFTASFYASVISGMLILPDSPQLVFWMASVYFMVRIVQGKPGKFSLNIQLLATGFFIGLCMLSKVHGFFLWAGFGAFIVFKKRELLKNPFLYTGVLITMAMLTPSFIWTVHNQFSTYNYHSSRIGFGQIRPGSFFRELAGSILYNNPLNVFLIISGCRWLYKNRETFVATGFTILYWLAFPLIGTVLILAVFNDTLPHWSGPAYTTLIPLAAVYVRNRNSSKTAMPVMPGIIRWVMGITGVALVAIVVLINYWPGSLGNKQMPAWGKYDVTLDMCGWRQFEHNFEAVCTNDRRSSPGHAPACIFTGYWFPAAHLDFYVGRPLGLPVRAVGSMGDIHHYAWLNQRLPALREGDDAYYITISNFYEPPPAALLVYFKALAEPLLIKQKRNGAVVRYFYVYRLMRYRGGLPANGIIK